MAVKTLKIDDQLISARGDETILEAAAASGIHIPTLCNLQGVSLWGACRLCLVEVSGSSKLVAACVTPVAEGMVVQTQTKRLKHYRRMIVELLFAEGNHICSVCVSNHHCELQDLAIEMGIDHVRFTYQFPDRSVDISHPQFGVDHNRCVLCTRCIRVCDEIEGAHTWDMAGRGRNSRVITDLNQPWGKPRAVPLVESVSMPVPQEPSFVVVQRLRRWSTIGANLNLFLLRERGENGCKSEG